MFSASLFVRKWGSKRLKKKWRRNGTKIKKKDLVVSSEQNVDEQMSDTFVNIRLNSKSEKDVGDDEKTSSSNFVFFKDDEDRFSEQYTVKLQTCKKYVVSVETNQLLTYVILGGKKYNCFKCITYANSSLNVYQFVWSTNGIKTTARKHRSVLPCVIKFQTLKQIKFNLSTKFYQADEKNHLFGCGLSSICLHCKFDEAKENIVVGKTFHSLWKE